MEIATEKRRKFIINFIYLSILLGLFYVFLKFGFGLLFPFLLAFFIAMILQKPINFICKKTVLKKGFVSTILVALLIAVVVFLLVLLGAKIVQGVKEFTNFIVLRFEDIPNFINVFEKWLLEKIRFLPDSIEKMLRTNIQDLFNKLTTNVSASGQTAAVSATEKSSLFGGLDLSILSKPISGMWSTAKQIPTIMIATVVSIFACCFMATDYDWIVNFVKLQLPAKRRNSVSVMKKIIIGSLGKLIKAYAILIFITFCEISLGLSFLSLIHVYTGGYIIFIALVVAVVDIMPVLGTGTVLIPWTLYSFIVGNFGLGVGIAVIYAIITILRQYIEPKLVANQLGLPPFVTIIGMYIGLRLFGIIGMFFVPMMIIFLKLLNDEGVIHIWKPLPIEEKTDDDEKPEKEKKKFRWLLNRKETKPSADDNKVQ